MNAFVPRRVLFPTLALYGLIVLMPCVYMLGRGSIGAWRRVWLNSRQVILLSNTVELALLAASGAVIFGSLLALLATKTNMPGRTVLYYLAFAQMFLPPHLLAIAGQYLWGGHFAGLVPAASVLAVSYYPLAFLLVAAGLLSIDPACEEAALLARGRSEVLRSMTLSLIYPYVMAAWVLVALLCIVEYGVTDLLRLNTFPLEIFAQFSAYYDQAAAAALCAPLLIVGIGLVLLVQKLLGARSFATLKTVKSARGARISLGSSVSVAVLFVTALLLALPVWSFTLNVATSKRTLISMLQSAPVAVSVGLAAAAATGVVVLGLPLAYAGARSARCVRDKILLLSLLPLAVPATVVGIGLVSLWNRDLGGPVYGSWLMPVLAYVARFSPFGTVVLFVAFQQLPAEQELAGLLVNGGWLRRIWMLVTPQCRTPISIAWILTFMFSLGELSASLLVMPPGAETLTLRLFNLMHYGAHDIVSCLALIQVIIGMAACTIILWITGITRKSEPWSI